MQKKTEKKGKQLSDTLLDLAVLHHRVIHAAKNKISWHAGSLHVGSTETRQNPFQAPTPKAYLTSTEQQPATFILNLCSA